MQTYRWLDLNANKLPSGKPLDTSTGALTLFYPNQGGIKRVTTAIKLLLLIICVEQDYLQVQVN